MSVWNSKTYIENLEMVCETYQPIDLYGKKLLITGASGLIGSAIIDVLLYCNRCKNAGITIYAAGRSEKKIVERFQGADTDGLVFVEYDATQEISWNFSIDYIIHGASNASPEKYVNEPVDTMLANILGMNNLLEYAKNNQVRKVVYVSSSEVYGKLNHGMPLQENEYGQVDILSERASYPEGKRAAEALCAAYAKQYGIEVAIARPGHVYGPTAQETDHRVSSEFARIAAEGKNLVMKSAGTQLRSYCHCLDCATAILTVLLQGKTKEAYNISNKDSVITIRRMAELIAESAGVKLLMDLPSEQEKNAFNPMDNSSLNSTKLEELGWKGCFSAEHGMEKTIKVLRECQSAIHC